MLREGGVCGEEIGKMREKLEGKGTCSTPNTSTTKKGHYPMLVP